jgi:hypothetical protein
LINHTLFNYADLEAIKSGDDDFSELGSQIALTPSVQQMSFPQQTWLTFLAAMFLVSVPVFLEAPLVRSLPGLSLGLTGLWIWLGFTLMSRPQTYYWGDILLGFSWSWLAGAIYWGWLRWEPLWHLPVESIGLPFAIWCIWHKWGETGGWFYLGSLLGTALTDAYFYTVDLLPFWRQIMAPDVDISRVADILKDALLQVETPWGRNLGNSYGFIVGNSGNCIVK